MYLALVPDAESLRALREFSPNLPDDCHLTVIHSKAKPAAAPPLPECWAGATSADVVGRDVFGSAKKVCVLKLRLSTGLVQLRAQAEAILVQAGLSWSSEWAFSPHVTVGRRSDASEQPRMLRFDRLEWRL